jgi:hypothetical protein
MPTVTKYPYNKQVNPITLKQEIKDDPAITIMIDHISANSTDVDIWFKDVLPTADETQLTAVVTAHTYTAPVIEDAPVPVVVSEEDVPTGGHFQSTTVKAISGTANEWNYTNYSWPFPISFLSAEINVPANLVGDFIEVGVFPDTIIGTITADCVATDTVINVAQSVIDNLDIGYFVSLSDGTNTEAHGNRVVAIDDVNNTITLSDGLANGYLAATPTYVRMTVDVIHDMELAEGRFCIGESKIGTSYLPANAVMRIGYKNINGNANPKELIAIFDYLY